MSEPLQGLALAMKRAQMYDSEPEPKTPEQRARDSDSCGCFKPTDCYGSHGWHWQTGDTDSPQGDICYERCDAYWSQVDRFETEDEEKGAPW